jgi:hypothetical protein
VSIKGGANRLPRTRANAGFFGGLEGVYKGSPFLTPQYLRCTIFR